MRVSSLFAAGVLFVGVCTSISVAQTETSVVASLPAGATLPVALKKTIDTAKAHPGDLVQFELLSPVIANHATVIPAKAKIYGKIVESHPLANNPFSSLAVAIESIAWKHNSASLHAFLIGFGKVRVTYFGKKSNCGGDADDRVAVAKRTHRDPEARSIGVAPRSGFDAQCEQVTARSETDPRNIEYIRLYRTTSAQVPVAFVSTKRSIVLKKGALLVIRNGAELPAASGISAKNDTPHQD